MATGTSSRAGDSARLESDLLMLQVMRQETANPGQQPFVFLMGDTINSVVKSDAMHAQSSPMAPVVVIKDLKKSTGDKVIVDMLHEPRELPIMGDNNVEGKEEGFSRSQFGLRIEQSRKPLFKGSRMTAQRRGYDVGKAAENFLTRYWRKYQSEMMWAHLAGARGKYTARDMILPAVEPVFDAEGMPADDIAERYVNPLLPPNFDRHFYGGDAESIDGANAITATDTLDIESIRQLALKNSTEPYPVSAVDLSSADKPAQTNPFNVLFVTPHQFNDCRNSAADFQTLISNALTATKGFDHPLFRGDMFMVDNILVCKYYRPIRWYAGDTMRVSANDRAATVSESQVPGGVPAVDRAIFLGGQALALALGGDSEGLLFKTFEEKFDADDKTRIVLRWIGGMKKMRQFDSDGYAYDTGVAVLDTAVATPL